MIERDESPYQACIREVREELGTDLPVYQLLCVEYRSAYGVRTDSLQFVFYGGMLDETQIASFCLPANEIAEYRFCSCAEAMTLLIPSLLERFRYALAAIEEKRTIYLENTKEILPAPW